LPTRGDYAYEVKWDEFRAIVSTEGALRVRSRRGWDMTERVGFLAELPVRAVLDGDASWSQVRAYVADGRGLRGDSAVGDEAPAPIRLSASGVNRLRFGLYGPLGCRGGVVSVWSRQAERTAIPLPSTTPRFRAMSEERTALDELDELLEELIRALDGLAVRRRSIAELAPTTRTASSGCCVCFWTALRISETLALRRRDVDFDAATIDVPGTKTEASEAPVPLLPALARELRAHRERQVAKGFDRIRPDALVFQTSRSSSRPRAASHPAGATRYAPSRPPP
jgi:hypothetical protein